MYDAEVKTRFVLFFVVSICIVRRESPYSFNGFSRLDSFVIKLFGRAFASPLIPTPFA